MIELLCLPTQVFNQSYLLFLGALQIPPLLRYVAEVHLVHGHLDVADGIVFGEAVKVVHGHDQRLSTELYVGDLSGMTTVTGQKNAEEVYCLIKGVFTYTALSFTWDGSSIMTFEVYKDRHRT